MYAVVVDETLLHQIVQRLVNALDPEKIVLFGSRARGDAEPDSDVDLLLIKDSAELPWRRTVRAHAALAGVGIPLDILWRTPGEIEEWAEARNYITTRAMREGRVLYERQPATR